MRKLGLLLAAMGVVSGFAYATPKLEVTGINQKLEYEHTNSNDKSDVKLYTTVNMKYDDWAFAIQGGKFWKYGTGNAVGVKKGLSSDNGRLQLEVWKSLNQKLKLGYMFRGEKDFDRHYARYSYKDGWFLSSADVWYQSNNGPKNNQIRMELFPLGVTYKGITAKWFVAYNRYIDGGMSKKSEKSSYEHQIRLYAPLYSNDVFSLSTEGRFTIHSGKTVENHVGYSYYKDFGRTRLYLKVNYKVSENFSVFGQYGYEFRDFKVKNNGEKPKTGDKNYQTAAIGWNYKF